IWDGFETVVSTVYSPSEIAFAHALLDRPVPDTAFYSAVTADHSMLTTYYGPDESSPVNDTIETTLEDINTFEASTQAGYDLLMEPDIDSYQPYTEIYLTKDATGTTVYTINGPFPPDEGNRGSSGYGLSSVFPSGEDE